MLIYYTRSAAPDVPSFVFRAVYVLLQTILACAALGDLGKERRVAHAFDVPITDRLIFCGNPENIAFGMVNVFGYFF
jgi:hypothetical protein